MGTHLPASALQSANDAVDTEMQQDRTVDLMNTRFDIYNGNTACPTGGVPLGHVKDVTSLK
jgi:hypothetical protein